MSSTTTATIPRLHNGDALDADEFMRRYEAMPDVKKAELIEGVVSMPSPVRIEHHGHPQADLMLWLGTYRLHTPNVRAADNTTIRLDQRSVPQPDALLWIVRGGQSSIASDDYLVGGPELVAEVAASSVSTDHNAKLRTYRDHGIREYLIWSIDKETIDWFILRDSQYAALSPGEDGIMRSEVFPGLWLDPAAMAGEDAKRVNDILMRGIASPEHAAFVERMRQPPAP